MGLNASDVAKGAQDAEKSFKKLEDALEDAGTGGARDVDKLEDALKGAQRQAERTEKSVKDIGDGGRAGFDKVKGGAHELQQEIGQNLGETVSSFRGDLSDLGQVGQDTLGGLAATVAGMGPAGLLGAFALAGGALGLGAVTAGIQDAEEKQRALNESAAEWADKYIEGASRIVDASSVVAEMTAIATDPDKYKQAGQNAEDWGVTVADAMRAMAGDATALEVVQRSLNDRSAEFAQIMKDNTGIDGFYKGTHDTTAQLHDMNESITRGTDALNAQTGAMAAGQAQADNFAAGLYAYAMQVGVATDQTDALGNKIYTLPDGKEIVVNAQTKQAYQDLDAVERRQLAGKEVGVRVRVDYSEWDDWYPPMKEGYVSARLTNPNLRVND